MAVKRFAMVVVVAAAGLALLVGFVYARERFYESAIVKRSSRDLVDLEAALMDREFHGVRSDLLFLASQPPLQHLLSGDGRARNEIEQEYLRFAERKKAFDQIRVLGNDGMELVRVNRGPGGPVAVPRDRLQEKASRYYYREALGLAPDEVFVSSFDLNVEGGALEMPLKPVIRFVAPVYDDAGKRQGFVVLNYMGERLLGELDAVSLGFRGRLLLVNREGEYLRGPSRDVEWGWILGRPGAFRSDYPDAWHRIGSGGESGQFVSPEGVFAYRRVVSDGREDGQHPARRGDGGGGNGLILVAHVPLASVYVEASRLLRKLLAVYAGAIAAVAALAWPLVQAGVVRRRQERQIATSEQRLRALSSQLLAAQEAERRSIARDLHDELAQQATAISLDLRSAASRPDGEQRDKLLQTAISEVQELLGALHDIVARVRPPVLDDLGLVDAVESLVSEFQARTGIHVDSRLHSTAGPVPTLVADNLYRILQEALNNIAQHARAKRVSVAMTIDERWLTLYVEDDGVGFVPAGIDLSRAGVSGMRERVELLSGAFEIESSPGAGVSIRIQIPTDRHE